MSYVPTTDFATLEPDETWTWVRGESPIGVACFEVSGAMLIMSDNGEQGLRAKFNSSDQHRKSLYISTAEPHIVDIRLFDKPVYRLNLNSYDQGDLDQTLMQITELDEAACAELKDYIENIRNYFFQRFAIQTIQCVPPQLTSTFRFQINLFTSEDILNKELIENIFPDCDDFQIERFCDHIMLLTDSSDLVRRINAILESDYGVPQNIFNDYLCRFERINCFIDRLNTLDSFNYATTYYHDLNFATPDTSRWFYRRLMQLSPRGLLNYASALESNKHIETFDRMRHLHNYELNSDLGLDHSQRVNLVMRYLTTRGKVNDRVRPHRSFLAGVSFKDNFLSAMNGCLFFLSAIYLLVIIPTSSIFKGLGRLLSFLPLGNVYRTRWLPGIAFDCISNGIDARPRANNDWVTQVRPLGALFDTISIMIECLIAVAIAPLVIPLAFFTAMFVIFKTTLDVINPFRIIQNGYSNFVRKGEILDVQRTINQDDLFKISHPITNMRNTSKAFAQLVDKNCGRAVPADQAIKIKANDDPGAMNDFRFFPALDRDLQEKIVGIAIDDCLKESTVSEARINL